MNKNKFTYITALTLLSFTLMTGCTNERKENQTAYRQIGINAMESGDYAGAVDAFNSALGQCIGKITENELDIYSFSVHWENHRERIRYLLL